MNGGLQGFGNPVFKVFYGISLVDTITFPVGYRRSNTHDNRELRGGAPIQNPFTKKITESVLGYRFSEVWTIRIGTWPGSIEDYAYHEMGGNQINYTKVAKLRNYYENGYTLRLYPHSEQITNYPEWGGYNVGIKSSNINQHATDRDASFEVSVFGLELDNTPDLSHLTFIISTPSTPFLNSPIYDNTTAISGLATAFNTVVVYNATDLVVLTTTTCATDGTWTATITAQTLNDVLYCYQTKNGVDSINSNNVIVAKSNVGDAFSSGYSTGYS